MICVVGLGYIGLPTTLMFAKYGNSIVGVDYDKKLVDKLNAGCITFEEKGLKELYDDAVARGVKFVSDYPKAEIYIVAVPTPYEVSSKKIDPKYVISAVEAIEKKCDDGAIIAIESTISPGTIDKYVRPIIEKSNKNIKIAHVPERIIPGNMIYELENNNRTIGVDDESTGEILYNLYSTFCKGKLTITSVRVAEMTKVVENTFRDINIAFANELARICRAGNMDVYEVIKIANMHPRVNILQPGPGVGGHCISVDPWFLVGDYPEQAKLIRCAREINDSQPEYVADRTFEIMRKNNIESLSKVGIYGLSYKANVDDVRESPSLKLLDIFKQRKMGNKIKVFDPMVDECIVENQIDDFETFVNSVEMVIVMVNHQHLIDNQDMIKDKVIYDTRNACVNLEVNRL